MPAGGRLEIGMKRTGAPASPPYNTVIIELETEATLTVDAIAVLPPFPHRLKRVNASVQVYDENWDLVASGPTPLTCHLPIETYRLVAQETVMVNDTELRLAAWVLVDSPLTEANATVNLWCDRYVYAIYAQGSLLEILSVISEVGFGDALVMLIDSPIQAIYDMPRLWPGAMRSIGNGSFLSAIFPAPRVVWTGSTPALTCLLNGEYTVIAMAHAPEGYELVGWEGVDEELGVFYTPLMGDYISVAVLNLTQDAEVRCIHELEDCEEPLLIVRAKLPDGTELPGVMVDVQGMGYHELAKAPYRRRLSGTYVIEVEGYLGADIVLVGWEGVDFYNGTRAIVDVGEGRLVWMVYEHTINPPAALYEGGSGLWPEGRASQVQVGLSLPEAPRQERSRPVPFFQNALPPDEIVLAITYLPQRCAPSRASSGQRGSAYRLCWPV